MGGNILGDQEQSRRKFGALGEQEQEQEGNETPWKSKVKSGREGDALDEQEPSGRGGDSLASAMRKKHFPSQCTLAIGVIWYFSDLLDVVGKCFSDL
jgi:hypothetical protein